MTGLEPLMERNFLEYASYVIVDRAIPDLRDGLKPVQRRILATLTKMDDGKFSKVANIIGETMKLHPHGDASIGDALVVLANKEYFIERQGNFGNVMTGHSAAAPRYIECRLTELARETLFSKALTKYQPSYDGRNKEPIALPAKIPVILMLGTEGIAVGMSTRILPHNFKELLEGQMAVLQHEPVRLFPDFLTGGLMDISEYDDGRGRVKVRARIDKVDDKTVVIREVPYSTTTEGLIASIESAVQKGKLRIGGINDFTTEKVEIEVSLPRGVHADEVIPQLYAYTDCEVSLSSNIVVISDRQPREMTVSELLRFLSEQLREQICAELEFELSLLKEKKHWLALERLFIEERVYKRIEEATTQAQVKNEVYAGLEPFFGLLERSIGDDDINKLLEIPIRKISLFDIDKNRRDLEDTELAIAKMEGKLSKLTQTTIKYIKGLLKKYGDSYPRRTKITTFEEINVRDVARQNIKLSYDPETGFFGSEVKNGENQLVVSEYDRILIITQDGTFRIVAPEEKILIPGKVVHMDVFDQKKGQKFTVIYRDKTKTAYGKKIHLKRFVRDREYELIKDKAGKLDYLIPEHAEGAVRLDFVPAKRQRVTRAHFDLNELDVIGVTARGRRLAPKPVAKLRWLKNLPDGMGENSDQAGEEAGGARPVDQGGKTLADVANDVLEKRSRPLSEADKDDDPDPSDEGGQISLF